MLHRMPTVNPRLSVTLTPELAAILRKVATLADKSQSAFVAELLEASTPVFERMAKLLEAAHEAKEHLSQDMAAGLEGAQARLESQLGLALGEMDEGFRPILEVAEDLRRRRPKAGGGVPARGEAPPASGRAGGATPVPVTRGSGTPRGGPAKGKKGGGRGRV